MRNLMFEKSFWNLFMDLSRIRSGKKRVSNSVKYQLTSTMVEVVMYMFLYLRDDPIIKMQKHLPKSSQSSEKKFLVQ